MNRKLTSWIFLVLFLALNISCTTSNTRTTDAGTQTKDASIHKIMVLFLGRIYENRKTLESEVTYYINDAGYEALPSVKFMPEKELPSNEVIVEILETNDFDGLMVIELVDLDVKDKFVNAQQEYVGNPTQPTFYNYFDVYRNRYSVGYATQEMSYVIETRIFKTSTREVVYNSTTKTIEKSDLDLAMEDFAKKTAKNIKSSKVMVKTK